MGKKAALFDTDEFNIEKELKQENIEEKQQVVKPAENKPLVSETKAKYMRLDLKGNNHAYVSFMADIENISMTQYINNLIDKDKEKNKEVYNKFIEIEKIKNNV